MVAQGVCMVALGGHVWLLPGGSMHGFFGGRAWFFLGCAWYFWGVCMVFSRGRVWFFWGGMHGFFQGGMCRIRRDTVNERALRILLECILVII